MPLNSNELRIIAMDIYNVENAAFSLPFWSTILGTILGSAILALDWFRPYQLFPIPCLIGACCGHWIGFIGIAIFHHCCSGYTKQE